MKRKNKIVLKFFAVALTVSFLYPFCSLPLNAEEMAAAPAMQSVTESRQEEEQENVPEAVQEKEQENMPEAEQEKSRETVPEAEWQESRETVPDVGQEEESESASEAGQEEGKESTSETGLSGEAIGDAQTDDAQEEEIAGREEIDDAEQEEAVAEPQPVVGRSLMALRSVSTTGIDGDDPEAGQSDTFGYTGGEVQWTVPVSGYYDIYCYGAKGGSGSAHQRNKYNSNNYASASGGNPGAARASRVFLQQGMSLTMHAGGAGGNGKCDSYAGRDQGGSGGYNDGGRGSGRSTICDNDDNHNGSCASGGGGGSSYILYGETKIISAAGGNGGSASYRCNDGSGSASGGYGGGSTALNSTDEVAWQTDELNEESYGVNSGDGYIQLTLIKVMPFVKLEAVPEDWTCDAVELTATVKSTGNGLGDNYLSWESAEDGSEIWTDSLTYTVDKNGTYTCKIRDIDGNTGTAEIRVDNIDKLKPSAEITSTQEWTTEPVTLTVSAEDRAATDEYGCSGLAEAAYLWGKNGERQEEEIWGTDITYTVDASGSYFCKVRDQAGNIRKVDYYIGCIDVTAPSATLTADQTKPTWRDVTLTVTATDTGIGLAELPYCWEQDEDGEDIWTAENTLVTDQNGLYHCKVRDVLGNTTEVTCLVNNIDKSLKYKSDSDGGSHSGGGGGENEPQKTEQDQAMPEGILPEELVEPAAELQTEQDGDGDDGHRGRKMSDGNRDGDVPDKLQELLGMTDGEPEIMEEEIITPIRPTLSPEPSDENAQHGTVQKEEDGKRFWDDPDIKTIILYSAWLAVILCGLAWLLFSLLFEHVTVYRADRKGRFRKAGRLVIVRKKDYRQINLTPLQEKNEDRKYKLRFSRGFAYLNKKEKILIRTYHGVELRNVSREIIM